MSNQGLFRYDSVNEFISSEQLNRDVHVSCSCSDIDYQASILFFSDGFCAVLGSGLTEGPSLAWFVLGARDGEAEFRINECTITTCDKLSGLDIVFAQENSALVQCLPIGEAWRDKENFVPALAFSRLPGNVVQLCTVREAQLLAAADDAGALALFSTIDAQRLDFKPGATSRKISVLASDGKGLLLSGDSGGQICAWSVTDACLTPIISLSAHGSISCTVIHALGRPAQSIQAYRVTAGTETGDLYAWDFNVDRSTEAWEKQEIQVMNVGMLTVASGPIVRVQEIPSGIVAVSDCSDKDTSQVSCINLSNTAKPTVILSTITPSVVQAFLSQPAPTPPGHSQPIPVSALQLCTYTQSNGPRLQLVTLPACHATQPETDSPDQSLQPKSETTSSDFAGTIDGFLSAMLSSPNTIKGACQQLNVNQSELSLKKALASPQTPSRESPDQDESTKSNYTTLEQPDATLEAAKPCDDMAITGEASGAEYDSDQATNLILNESQLNGQALFSWDSLRSVREQLEAVCFEDDDDDNQQAEECDDGNEFEIHPKPDVSEPSQGGEEHSRQASPSKVTCTPPPGLAQLSERSTSGSPVQLASTPASCHNNQANQLPEYDSASEPSDDAEGSDADVLSKWLDSAETAIRETEQSATSESEFNQRPHQDVSIDPTDSHNTSEGSEQAGSHEIFSLTALASAYAHQQPQERQGWSADTQRSKGGMSWSIEPPAASGSLGIPEPHRATSSRVPACGRVSGFVHAVATPLNISQGAAVKPVQPSKNSGPPDRAKQATGTLSRTAMLRRLTRKKPTVRQILGKAPLATPSLTPWTPNQVLRTPQMAASAPTVRQPASRKSPLRGARTTPQRKSPLNPNTLSPTPLVTSPGIILVPANPKLAGRSERNSTAIPAPSQQSPLKRKASNRQSCQGRATSGRQQNHQAVESSHQFIPHTALKHQQPITRTPESSLYAPGPDRREVKSASASSHDMPFRKRTKASPAHCSPTRSAPDDTAPDYSHWRGCVTDGFVLPESSTTERPAQCLTSWKVERAPGAPVTEDTADTHAPNPRSFDRAISRTPAMENDPGECSYGCGDDEGTCAVEGMVNDKSTHPLARPRPGGMTQLIQSKIAAATLESPPDLLHDSAVLVAARKTAATYAAHVPRNSTLYVAVPGPPSAARAAAVSLSGELATDTGDGTHEGKQARTGESKGTIKPRRRMPWRNSIIIPAPIMNDLWNPDTVVPVTDFKHTEDPVKASVATITARMLGLQAACE